MYYRSGTGRTLLHRRQADASRLLTRWQHLLRHGAHLKVWRQIENPTKINFTWRTFPPNFTPIWF